ncbi:prenyltransferase [Lysinibacter sp. HNR]|uniref:prenyltransferase n=1 Tax=Lysinibacter sp. HNR TaxID=3031408 RepID=UPI002435879B|nr:prenyltransferase [Lysinibacter sp. HNR]WGD36412.1 prenyltransferase [Lysinibacter sp. HNR]
MSYPALALLGSGLTLVLSLIILAVAKHRRNPTLTNPGSLRRHWSAIGLTVLVLFTLTAIFDNLMIGSGLFTYAPEYVGGLMIGLVPIEDFAYPLAGTLLLPSLWILLQHGGVARRRGFAQLILSSRPVSWVNTAFPFGAAYLLTTHNFDWVFLVGSLYFLIPYNLAMYGINDVFDYESDLRNPRKGGIEGALLDPQLHRPILWTAAIINLPFLALLAAAGGPNTWLALGVSVFAVIAYSVKGLRFKERPVLDSITSSTHFVSPALVGLTLGGADFSSPILLVLGAFFLWGMAAHAFGAIQDIAPDRDAGIHSIATVFGARRTARFAFVLWVLAGTTMLLTPWPGPLAGLIAVPYLLNCAPWLNLSDADAHRTHAAWRRFIFLNFFSGFLATLILIIEWNIS